jgi:mTERF
MSLPSKTIKDTTPLSLTTRFIVSCHCFTDNVVSRRKKRNSSGRSSGGGGGAPLVDSALLRYISKQKGETETQLQLWEWMTNGGGVGGSSTSDVDGADVSGLMGTGFVEEMILKEAATTSTTTLGQSVGSLADSVLQGGVGDYSQQSGTNMAKDNDYSNTSQTSTFVPLESTELRTTTETMDTISSPPSLELIKGQETTTTTVNGDDLIGVDNNTADSSASMGQYNKHRVAQKLVLLGADPDLAQVAGESVQRHLLVRTARRRIRIFLRRRDDLWSDSSPKSNQELMSDDPFASDSGARGKPIVGSSSSVSSMKSEQDIIPEASSSALSISPDYGFDDLLDVMQEFGLTGVDICAILTHSPSLALMMPRKTFLRSDGATFGAATFANDALEEQVTGVTPAATTTASSSNKSGETVEETLNRSLNTLLMKTLGLRRYDARSVLRNTPGLLTMRGSKSAEQVINMMNKLGVSEKKISRDLLSLPDLLSRSPAGMFRLVSFLCSSSLRIPMNQIGPLLRRRVSLDLLDAVVPIPASRRQFTSSSSVGKKSQIPNDGDIDPITEAAFWSRSREERNQQIEEIYRNMTQTVMTIRNEIGPRDFTKIVTAYPTVLLLDAERQIMPVATFLFDELGISDGDLASVLQMYPMLLGKDIEDMQRNVRYMKELGVREDDLGSMFRAYPALLTMDIKGMQPVVKYLESIGVTDVGAFVTNIPPVLGYNIEQDLKPKWTFLKTVCMHANFELNKFPNYFSYPLERVIKTRYEYLAVKGIARQLIPVDAVLRYGDLDFARTVARDDDGGEAFLAFSKKRQKLIQKKQETTNQRPKGRRRRAPTTSTPDAADNQPQQRRREKTQP